MLDLTNSIAKTEGKSLRSVELCSKTSCKLLTIFFSRITLADPEWRKRSSAQIIKSSAQSK